MKCESGSEKIASIEVWVPPRPLEAWGLLDEKIYWGEQQWLLYLFMKKKRAPGRRHHTENGG